MYRSGIDVIHHSAGMAGTALPDVADELTGELGRRLWVIGSEVDEQRLAPDGQKDNFLTSMWKRWDRALFEAVRSYLAGELVAGRYELGLDTGAVDYSTEGGLAPIHASRLDEIESEILAGRILPPSASGEPPRWTREPVVTADINFDGRICSSDTNPIELATGDVVRLNIFNESAEVLAFAIGKLAEGVDPSSVWSTAGGDPWAAGLMDFEVGVAQALTDPGGMNAVSMRLTTGSYVANCFAEDGTAFPGTAFTARFESTCQESSVESDDPAEVMRALTVALNARDPVAVCSLFAENATAEIKFGPEPLSIAGNQRIADFITAKDDDLWIQNYVLTGIETAGPVVTSTSEYQYFAGDPLLWCSTAEVSDGKIVAMEAGPCPPTG